MILSAVVWSKIVVFNFQKLGKTLKCSIIDKIVFRVLTRHYITPYHLAIRKKKIYIKLEQLERLRSEDTPRRLMITHTIESCWIPSQN